MPDNKSDCSTVVYVLNQDLQGGDKIRTHTVPLAVLKNIGMMMNYM